MATVNTGTTHWRDKPIVPTPGDYEDVARLVMLARKARKRVVEFQWIFTREDLLSLRRAAYEWGSAARGTYRGRSARVLAAINHALGDTHSVYVLGEPKNAKGMTFDVSWTRDDEAFHLTGHASFDLVVGYAIAAFVDDPGSIRLTPAARQTLGASARMLGWDLQVLHQDARLRPALNALFGAPPSLGVKETSVPSGPPTDVGVRFHGPFVAQDGLEHRCLFTEEITKRSGVYLWTTNIEGQERPWYVGQTRRTFRDRMAEHLACVLSGEYAAYDAVALAGGELRLAGGAIIGMWPQTLPSFLRNYETLMPNVIGQIRLVHFYVAPLDGDAHLYDRIEGAIGRYFKVHPDPVLRDFFGLGIKLPAAIPGDRPVRLVLSSESPIAGLPPEILT